MTGGHEPPFDVTPDLVEYLIVTAPDHEALAEIVPALAELVESAMIRILDVAVLVRDDDGAVTPIDVGSIPGMVALAERHDIGGLLSDHDLQLAGYALAPGSAAVVLVTEDRWAEPLSNAARRAGGQIVAGERIPATHVTAVLGHRADHQPGGF
jgi:uncharacterized membrane protein